MKMNNFLFALVLLNSLPRSHGVLRTAKNIGWQPRESKLQQDNNQQGAFPLLKLGTDEVHITFHALDAVGRTAADISSQDLQILDDGKPPLRLLRFEHLANLPIRAGLIFDTSRSMLGEIKDNRATANLYASQLLRLGLDRAFLMRFDSDSKVLQDWTDANVDLLHKLDAVGSDYRSRMGGTKLYDSVYKACRDQWLERPVVATGNFVLLFTDGQDNASNAHLSEVVEMCQQRQVAIYVVTREQKVRSDAGQRVLNELSMQTGGALIFTKTDADVAQALSAIRHTVDDRYTVVYKPRFIKRNGKFHKLRLACTQHCYEIKAPSGYYAPGT